MYRIVYESLGSNGACYTGSIYIGKQFYIGAYKALRNKSANMDVLVALGTSAAYFYSVYLAIQSIGNMPIQYGLYFETSAVLITLIILRKII